MPRARHPWRRCATAERSDSGQALVESAIVIPLVVFVFLCTLQIMLIAHTRVLVDYAAFNAARAGVVHNGDQDKMRSAGLISLMPSFPSFVAGGSDVGTLGRVLRAWAIMQAWSKAGQAIDGTTGKLENFLTKLTNGEVNVAGIPPNVGVVSVDVLNPHIGHFDGSPTGEEIDFDQGGTTTDDPNAVTDATQLDRTRLTIRLVYLYPLRVPLADRTIWNLYLLGAFVGARLAQSDFRNWWEIKGEGDESVREMIDGVDFVVGTRLTNFGWQGLAAAAREQLMFEALRRLDGIYLLPLWSIHSMPMESNFYKKNL